MKRRTPGAVSHTEQAPGPSDPKPPAGGTDWVSPPAEPPANVNRELERAAATHVTEGRKQPSDGWADDVRNTDAGDSITVTIGKEILYPVKFNGVEVGPLSMTVRIRQGETAGKAYERARVVLEH